MSTVETYASTVSRPPAREVPRRVDIRVVEDGEQAAPSRRRKAPVGTETVAAEVGYRKPASRRPRVARTKVIAELGALDISVADSLEEAIDVRELTEEERGTLRAMLGGIRSSYASETDATRPASKARATYEQELADAVRMFITSRTRLRPQSNATVSADTRAAHQETIQNHAAYERLHASSPEAEINAQLSRVFAGPDQQAIWEEVRGMGARRFLAAPDAGSPVRARLKAYLQSLINESGVSPRGGFWRRNESIEAYIIRATEALFDDNARNR